METILNKYINFIENLIIKNRFINFTFSFLFLMAVITFISAVSIKITLGLCAVLYGALQILELNK
jgi:hypothetical protein